MQNGQRGQVNGLRPTGQILLHGGWDTVQRSITVELQGPNTRGWIEAPVDGLGCGQPGRHVDSVRYQCVNIDVVFPTPSNLNHPHLHASQIDQGSNPHSRSIGASRLLHMVQPIQTTKEGYLDQAAPIYECFQVIAFAVDPDVGV